MPTIKKSKCPFASDQVVVAVKTFATERGVVHVGDKFRGGDPVVLESWTAFVDGDTLPNEMPNFWTDLVPDPPDHSIPVPPNPLADVPPHRLVRATANFWWDAGWAPGSEGATRFPNRPTSRGWGIQAGTLVEITHPAVQASPQHFEFPRRDVTLADIERALAEDAERPAA